MFSRWDSEMFICKQDTSRATFLARPIKVNTILKLEFT